MSRLKLEMLHNREDLNRKKMGRLWHVTKSTVSNRSFRYHFTVQTLSRMVVGLREKRRTLYLDIYVKRIPLAHFDRDIKREYR